MKHDRVVPQTDKRSESHPPLEPVETDRMRSTAPSQAERRPSSSDSSVEIVSGAGVLGNSIGTSAPVDIPSSSSASMTARDANGEVSGGQLLREEDAQGEVDGDGDQYSWIEELVSTADYRLFFDLLPQDRDLRSGFLDYVARARYGRFEQIGNFDDIEEAVNLRREALSLRPSDHNDRSDSLNNLAATIQTRYQRFGDISDIDEAITLHRESLSLRPVGHNCRSSSLINLANAIQNRYERFGDIDDISEAVAFHREALSLRPGGHTDRSSSLGNLASAIHTRYARFGDVKDIDEAIALQHEALSLQLVGHNGRSHSLNNLANAIHTRYERFGDAGDVNEAIALHREALSLIPVGHSDRPSSLSNLANSIHTRYERFSNINDVNEAIAIHREALSLRPLGHTNRSQSLNNLANAIQTRYDRFGDVNDINEAITLHREALSLSLVGHSDRSRSLHNLANAIGLRYGRFGDINDTNEAIVLHREALSLRPVGHKDRSSSLNSLASAIHTRCERFGDVNDVNEAIALHQEALSLMPVGHNDRSNSLNNLAHAIRTRYEWFGDICDIDEAIALHRESLSLRPAGHSNRSRSLCSLANAIHLRYKRFGDVNDINEAIALHRESLSLRPVGHTDRASSLNYLAGSIKSRYEWFGDVNDVNEAIALHQEALSLRPAGHPDRSSSLNNLANAVQSRYERLGGVNDINEAVTLHREVLSLLPVDHTDRSVSLNNLATAIRARYQLLSEVSDLEEAELLLRGALALRPPGRNGRFRVVAQLSDLLIIGVVKGGYDRSSSLRAIEEAQSLVNEALEDSSAPIALQLNQASYHGSISVYGSDFRISMHFRCILLLQRLVVISPNITSQQLQLHQHKDIASTLAACALDAGSPETAAIVSDGGRSLLLGTIQQYRSPVEELQQVDQELADQLHSVGSQLERLALLGESKALVPEFATNQDFMLTMQRNLREQWSSLLDQIHTLPGFEHFLTVRPFHELQVAASCGPIILLNADNSRCDAVIIFSSGSPEVVPFLDPVSLHSLVELHRDLDASRRDGPVKERQTLFRIFRFLWEHAVSKVVDCLGTRGVKKGSRVWWCPAAVFTLLPIHAAGMYNGHPDCNFSDIYISSYTPTISELIRARRPKLILVQPFAESNRLLFIGNSGQSSSLGELVNVGMELKAIQNIVNDTSSMTATDAKPDDVLETIQQHLWAHFSCHGMVDTEDPTRSHFVLEDSGRLHVKDILNAKLDGAELAFLSACHSAAPGLTLPDEGIHLSSAMMFAGFRSVIGTMWEMYDEEGPVVSGLFYKNLVKLGGRHTDAAEALHLTIKSRRRLDAKQRVFRPERWAMFIHIGA